VGTSLDRYGENTEKEEKEGQIKKAETETKDKLIKKGQPIAQSPPNATHTFRGTRNRLLSIHLLMIFLVVSLSLFERVDERRGMVSHMHKDGVSRNRGQVSGMRKRKWARSEVALSRRLDSAVNVHLLLDFGAGGDALSKLGFLVSSLRHLEFFFSVTINGIGRAGPIAAGRTPCP